MHGLQSCSSGVACVPTCTRGQMVKDDLGLKRSDLEGIKRRLAKQGITDVVAVSTSF